MAKRQHTAKKTLHTEPGSFASRYPNEAWVKIPDKPTVGSMVVSLSSLVTQLQSHDKTRRVTGIELSAKDKAIRIKLQEAKEP